MKDKTIREILERLVFEHFGDNIDKELQDQALAKIKQHYTGLIDEKKIEKIINSNINDIDYGVDDYEVRGYGGDYTPNADERFMIEDFHRGYTSELMKAFKKSAKAIAKEMREVINEI